MCIHGLVDNNCPICRINASTIPIESNKIKNVHHNELKPYFHDSKLNSDITNNIVPKIYHHNDSLEMNVINPIPEVKILNKLPNFKNRMFLERLNELNLDKSDIFDLVKKESLESPEWKFEE